MRQTDLEMHTTLKNRHKPGRFFIVCMENAYYNIHIKYLDTQYDEDFASNRIQPDAILINIHKKIAGIPDIYIALETGITKEHIGIDLQYAGFLEAKQIPEYQEHLYIAQRTLNQVIDGIRKYFPGVIQDHERKE